MLPLVATIERILAGGMLFNRVGSSVGSSWPLSNGSESRGYRVYPLRYNYQYIIFLLIR